MRYKSPSFFSFIANENRIASRLGSCLRRALIVKNDFSFVLFAVSASFLCPFACGLLARLDLNCFAVVSSAHACDGA